MSAGGGKVYPLEKDCDRDRKPVSAGARTGG